MGHFFLNNQSKMTTSLSKSLNKSGFIVRPRLGSDLCSRQKEVSDLYKNPIVSTPVNWD